MRDSRDRYSRDTINALIRWLRGQWIFVVAALFGVALLVGPPAWAAPVPRPLNQTVPRPTPTSDSGPIPTATPRPDDDDDDDDDDEGDTGDEGDLGSPQGPVDNSDIFGAPVSGEPAAPATAYTAVVDAATLNVREGPGTDFAVVGTLNAGDAVTVTARNEDASWWFICCATSTGAEGWVSAQLVTPNFDRAQAGTLLPLYGTVPAGAAPEAAAEPAAAAAAEPLIVEFVLDPPFVWQEMTGTLEINLTNPNTDAVTDVQLSDELPAELTLLDAAADGGGEVEQTDTAGGRPLIIARWATIPGGTSVSAAITFQVDSDLTDGAVIDNLVAVRGANSPYQTAAVTIGMPPAAPPTFD